jgi:hypothetical protein
MQIIVALVAMGALVWVNTEMREPTVKVRPT